MDPTQEAKALRDAGLCYRQIAELLGMSRSAAHRLVVPRSDTLAVLTGEVRPERRQAGWPSLPPLHPISWSAICNPPV